MTDSENWDEERELGDHPAVAALIGGAVFVLAGLLVPRLTGPVPLKPLLAVAAGAAAVAWAIGYALTIRRASTAWKAGSFAILLGVALASAVGAFMQFRMQTRADAMTLAEMEPGPGGTLMFPRGGERRGPVSRLFADAVRAAGEERRSFGAAAAPLGMEALNGPYELRANPAVLGRCGEIGGLKRLGAETARGQRARIGALERLIASGGYGTGLERGMRMMLAPADTPEAIAAMRARQDALLDATQELCVLLARRSWVDRGYFAFPSQAEVEAFNALAERRGAAARDMARLEREGRERARAGQELVRDRLSGSIFPEIWAALGE